MAKSEQNSLNLTLSSETADRFRLSDRAFGAVASGVLADIRMINDRGTKFVVDKNKVRRARVNKRKVEETNLYFDGLALFFDGRKDNTLKQAEINGT